MRISLSNVIAGTFAAGVLAAGMGSGAADAASVSYNDSFAFPLSPGSDVVTLPQFDDNGGLYVLTSIELSVAGDILADVTAENDSTISGNMSVNLSGNFSITDAPFSLFVLVNDSAGPVAVDPSDGVADSGPDFHDFGSIGGSGSNSDTIFGGFAPFVGAGTVDFTVNGSGGFSVSGVADSSISVSNFGADGVATITYNYDIIPEPASLALISLGSLVMLRRRR